MRVKVAAINLFKTPLDKRFDRECEYVSQQHSMCPTGTDPMCLVQHSMCPTDPMWPVQHSMCPTDPMMWPVSESKLYGSPPSPTRTTGFTSPQSLISPLSSESSGISSKKSSMENLLGIDGKQTQLTAKPSHFTKKNLISYCCEFYQSTL